MNGKEIFVGLQEIGEDLIQEAECGRFPAQMRKRSKVSGRVRRYLWIAAAAAATVLLVGCAAVLLGVTDLTLKSQNYVEKPRYQEDGSKTAEVEKIRQFLCAVGTENSENYQAVLEYYVYQQEIQPDWTKIDTSDPENAPEYVAYTRALAEKQAEICEKYGLKQEGESLMVLGYQGGLLDEILGFLDAFAENSRATGVFTGGYFSRWGNFSLDYQVTLTGQEDVWKAPVLVHYLYRDKEVFSPSYFRVEDAQSMESWNFTTEDGTQLLAVTAGENAYLFCDREDAFLSIWFRREWENWDGDRQTMTRQQIQQVAQVMDYSLKPRVVDMEQAEYLLEESRAAHDNQKEDPALTEANVQAHRENTQKDSYAALIAQIRDNEDYFTGCVGLAYENFWESMAYALLDVTGDGEEELIFGREGKVQGIWTMVDGKTRNLAGNTEGYLCRGNVLEWYDFNDGQPWHHYEKLEADGTTRTLLELQYEAFSESWWLREGDEDTRGTTVSEEQALEIIGSFPRMEVEMKPVKEFDSD